MNGHCTLVAVIAALLALPAIVCAQPPDRQQMVRYAAESGEGTWQRAQDLPPNLTSRELFAYALALCEAKMHPERLGRLFEVATRLQDRAPESGGYGNFRWSWKDGAVLDYNAVEFCMQAGTLIWMRHRETIPADVRETLRELLEYSVEGCQRHRVPESYTNIALMNAENLILLGEGLEKPEVADEGYARLDRICLYTWEFGTHEYCSPTYYGTDLDCLVLTQAFCTRERGREQVRALLELLWTDIALNWLPWADKLGGTRSRDYDYLRGLGYLDVQMWANGWLSGDLRGGTSLVYSALAKWQPPQRLREMSQQRLPRLVRQSWGIGGSHSRTHYVLPDVSLSSSAANYGPMDLPLTADFPGDRESVRCYFIPDARRDPYGKKRIPAGGGHEKTLHLRPFFTAAQRTVDALGLVVYRDGDLTDTPATLESHIVLPLDVDGIWIGDAPVQLDPGTPAVVPIDTANGLVIRKGSAAIGIRVPWTRGLDGQTAPVALAWDGNDYGAMRLTVAHHSFWGIDARQGNAGAAFWLRVGSGLNGDQAFRRWQQDFAAAADSVQASAESVRVEVEGVEGAAMVAATAPFAGPSALEPPPSRAVLELDGEDIGKAILAGIEPINSYQEQIAAAPANALAPDKGTYLEAEAGLVLPNMVVAEGPEASGGEYVWTPGEPGEKGGGQGSVTWRLRVLREGTYYVWGRIMAATPDDDSFLVRVLAESSEPVTNAEWHTGTHEQWEWVGLSLARQTEVTPIALPSGEVSIQLRTREDGTRIDRLFITPDADERPE
jgi:hypothetical protein